MANQLATVKIPKHLAPILNGVPVVVAAAGHDASYRFVRFFVETIRNKNTREAYARAVRDFFEWCEERKLSLHQIEPVGVSAYIEQLTAEREPAGVKQHLAAIRMLFDWLTNGGIIPFNPASSVKGPRMSYRKGKTPVLDAVECRMLLDSIEGDKLADIRDRALIGVMVFSFARVSAAIGMNRADYRTQGKKSTFRLHEKGGKFNEIPAHHLAEQYIDEYLAAARLLTAPKDAPLFRSFDRRRRLSDRRLNRRDSLAMIKRRAKNAGLPPDICCHTFRGTGITTYLKNGGDRSKAAQIAGHASERTTSLYDRRNDEVDRGEIEKVQI